MNPDNDRAEGSRAGDIVTTDDSTTTELVKVAVTDAKERVTRLRDPILVRAVRSATTTILAALVTQVVRRKLSTSFRGIGSSPGFRRRRCRHPTRLPICPM